jgi:hypothetical protein
VKVKKAPVRPNWVKNTYFWLGAILFILGIVGLPMFGGDEAIRDPGQKREDSLYLLYFVASVVMFVNGWLSQKQAVQHFEEEQGSK